MSYFPLDTADDLEQALVASHEAVVVLFKHSVTCPVSAAAQSVVNRVAESGACPVYRLVVQHSRPLSNAIAQRFGIRHESPQVLVLSQGRIEAHTSHYGITTDWLKQHTAYL